MNQKYIGIIAVIAVIAGIIYFSGALEPGAIVPQTKVVDFKYWAVNSFPPVQIPASGGTVKMASITPNTGTATAGSAVIWSTTVQYQAIAPNTHSSKEKVALKLLYVDTYEGDIKISRTTVLAAPYSSDTDFEASPPPASAAVNIPHTFGATTGLKSYTFKAGLAIEFYIMETAFGGGLDMGYEIMPTGGTAQTDIGVYEYVIGGGSYDITAAGTDPGPDDDPDPDVDPDPDPIQSQLGALEVRTTASCDVFIDGPITLASETRTIHTFSDIPYGTYDVIATRTGYQTQYRTVTIDTTVRKTIFMADWVAVGSVPGTDPVVAPDPDPVVVPDPDPDPDDDPTGWSQTSLIIVALGIIGAILAVAFLPVPPKFKGIIALLIAAGAVAIAYLMETGGL